MAGSTLRDFGEPTRPSRRLPHLVTTTEFTRSGVACASRVAGNAPVPNVISARTFRGEWGAVPNFMFASVRPDRLHATGRIRTILEPSTRKVAGFATSGGGLVPPPSAGRSELIPCRQVDVLVVVPP